MNTILKIEGAIILLLVIVWMMGELAFKGMELDMMYYDYEYQEMMQNTVTNGWEEEG